MPLLFDQDARRHLKFSVTDIYRQAPHPKV